jgi:hypothetical protein
MMGGWAGLPGSGKSCSAVDLLVCKVLAAGGVVQTNIPLLLGPWFNREFRGAEFPVEPPSVPLSFVDVLGERFGYAQAADLWHKETACLCRVDAQGRYWANARGLRWHLRESYGWVLQDGQLHHISAEAVESGRLHESFLTGRAGANTLIVLDEALDWFEFADRAAQSEFLSFLRHHRHHFVDLWFIAQSWDTVTKRIRDLILERWEWVDLRTWRVPGVKGLRICPPWIHGILGRQLDRQGNFIGRRWYRPSPGVYGSYDTTAQNGGYKLGGEAGAFKRSDKGKGVADVTKGERFLLVASAMMSAGALVVGLRDGRAGEGGRVSPSAAGPGPVTAHVARSVSPAPSFAPVVAPDEHRLCRLSCWPERGSVVFAVDGARAVPGETSALGFVLSADEHLVRVLRPDGGILWCHNRQGGTLPPVPGPGSSLVGSRPSRQAGRPAAVTNAVSSL